MEFEIDLEQQEKISLLVSALGHAVEWPAELSAHRMRDGIKGNDIFI